MRRYDHGPAAERAVRCAAPLNSKPRRRRRSASKKRRQPQPLQRQSPMLVKMMWMAPARTSSRSTRGEHAAGTAPPSIAFTESRLVQCQERRQADISMPSELPCVMAQASRGREANEATAEAANQNAGWAACVREDRGGAAQRQGPPCHPDSHTKHVLHACCQLPLSR